MPGTSFQTVPGPIRRTVSDQWWQICLHGTRDTHAGNSKRKVTGWGKEKGKSETKESRERVHVQRTREMRKMMLPMAGIDCKTTETITCKVLINLKTQEVASHTTQYVKKRRSNELLLFKELYELLTIHKHAFLVSSILTHFVFLMF